MQISLPLQLSSSKEIKRTVLSFPCIFLLAEKLLPLLILLSFFFLSPLLKMSISDDRTDQKQTKHLVRLLKPI